MVQVRRLIAVAFVIVAVLLCAAPASAGPFWDWLTHRECPSPTYSPLNYWAPSAVHLYADVHGPKISVYAANMHPEVPPTYDILKFKRKCPAPDPAATLIAVPTPPPESRSR
jgi:hypothetical protein